MANGGDLPAMGHKGIFIAVGATIVAAFFMVFSPFSGIREVAHESTQLHLHLIGSSIYEYHSRTGKWPTQIEDLAKTSLPQQSPYWKLMLDEELAVIALSSRTLLLSAICPCGRLGNGRFAFSPFDTVTGPTYPLLEFPRTQRRKCAMRVELQNEDSDGR
jgi:hypothetical protein